MRSPSSLLCVASLGLVLSACAAATPEAVRPATGNPPPGAPVTRAPSPPPETEAITPVRIPVRTSAPEDHFERIRGACSASRALRGQLQSMPAPAVDEAGLSAGGAGAKGGDTGNVKAAASEDVVQALRRFQDEVREVKAAEEKADKEKGAVPAPLAGAQQKAPQEDRLAEAKKLYRVFLEKVATIADRCDVIDGSAPPAPAGSHARSSLDATREVAGRSELEVALLERQVQVHVPVWKATRAASLDPLLEGRAQSGTGTAALAAAPGLGSLESALINGLADFVVTRAKAESIQWVKAHVAAELCGARPALLPHLCLAFKDMDPSLSLQAMGAYLQAAALQDLEALPEALLLQDPKRGDEASALLLGMTLFREVHAGRSPIEAARGVQHVVCKTAVDAGKWGKIAPAACAGSALIDAIVRQRREGVGTDGTPASQARELAMAALLSLQQSLGDDAALDGLSKEELEALVSQAQALVADVEGLEKDLHSVLAEAKGGKVTADARLAVATRAVAVLVRSARAGVCALKSAKCEAGKEAPGVAALSFVESAAGFASALYSHDAGSMAIAVQAALSALGTLMKDHPEWEPVRRLLPFVVELASAKKSADVAAALEAAASPVNSYEAKYDRRGIAVNAFLGGSVGVETTTTGKWSGVLSLSAPVGVHMTAPFTGEKSLFHYGLFVSVIDLGALTATRLAEEGDAKEGETTVETAPSVGFAQVFSPGMFLTLGLGRSPLVFGVGGSVTPSLRKATVIGGSGATVEEIPAFRLQAFLGIDVPILAF